MRHLAKKVNRKTRSSSPKLVVNARGKNSKANLITTKGQVTIPQKIRESRGFLPNTAVEFIIEGDRVYLEKSQSHKPSRGQQIVNNLKGRCKTRMTTEDLMKLTRGSKLSSSP